MCWKSRISVALLLSATVAGCTPETIESLFGRKRTSVPVYFVRAEGLEQPSAGNLTHVFKPAALFGAGPTDDAGPQVFDFTLVLASSDPANVEMRLIDWSAGTNMALARISAPAIAEVGSARSVALSDGIRQKLAAGSGVFWQIGGATESLEQRFGVLLPASVLTPFTRLEMYSSKLADGTPVGVDSIELVPDFCYTAVIGDSVLWGNGLEDRDKIAARVARVIEQETGRRVVTQLLAQSGATIVPGPGDGVCSASCNGEVPFVPTSITTQVGLVERPDLIEFALVDGCANDISIPTILSPQTTDAEMEALASEFCDAAMVGLLQQISAALPNAAIVVTGYYPFVSDESSSLGLRVWEITRGAISSEGEAPLVDELTHQSALFAELTSANLRAAIATVQASDPTLRIGFAEPPLGPSNTAFAPDSWLWGVTSQNTLFEDLNLIQTLNLDLFPEDPVQSVRVQLCFDPSNTLTLLDCLYASIGHPNPDGAQAYAEQVIERLREIGVLPTSR